MLNSNRQPQLEVLAPAGELEQLKIAVWHGADAVYLAAKDFGMRSTPANFTFDQLRYGVDFAHARGVKVYQTVNVLPTNQEVEQLEDFLVNSVTAGIDAAIVSDVGALLLARRVVPELDVHISVQMGVVNYLTANELANLGAKRIVLARELTIEEIAEIHQHISEDVEIECFVHGAICMSVSGRCLISKYLVNRDANHGECAQPCRWEYDISDPRNPNVKLNVVENMVKDQSGKVVSQGSYILNSKDLCLIEHIPQLVQAGITSFKIEGRAKSSFYVASAVNAYRKAVDWYLEFGELPLPEEILADVQKISHREYTTGFYFSAAKTESGEIIDGMYDVDQSPSSYFDKGYKQEWEPGAVKLEDGWHQRSKFYRGACVEVLTPNNSFNNVLDSLTISPPSQIVPSQMVSELVVVSIYALDNEKTRKNGEQLPNPIELESTAHADQLLNFRFTTIHGEDLADNFPIGTFLRLKKSVVAE